MDTPQERLLAVQNTVAEATRRAGRRPEDVKLVAVSKTHAPEDIREVADAGQTTFGESRVQEAQAKIPTLGGHLHWHFIGHLQKNKIRAALPLFELFHGIDSLETARHFQRIAAEEGHRPQVLLEVNVAGESTKFGFPLDAIKSQLEDILALDRLEITGLMAMAPYDPEPEHSRPYFQRLRELRDDLAAAASVDLPQLSMGMSGDYGIAIEEGATIVRVGTAIFGTRAGKRWVPAAEEA